MVVKYEICRSPAFSENVFTNLSQLRSTDIFTDFSIKVTGQEFACHKVVLAAACPYFQVRFNLALLSQRMRERMRERFRGYTISSWYR